MFELRSFLVTAEKKGAESGCAESVQDPATTGTRRCDQGTEALGGTTPTS